MSNRFKGVRAAVVGDVILDVFIDVKQDRPSSEDSDAWCYAEGRELRLPGGAGCVARALVSLGGSAEVYGVSGVGHSSIQLVEALKAHGIEVNLVSDSARPTTVKTRYMNIETRRQVGVFERQVRQPVSDEVGEDILSRVRKIDSAAILVADYNRGVVSPQVARGLSAFARESEKRLIVDARPRPVSWYEEHFPHLYLVTPNRQEAEKMLDCVIRDEGDVLTAGRELRARLRCNVLVTLSEQGACLFQTDGEEYRYRARDVVKPACVSGAGDTLVATIALGVGSGMTLQQACQLGQYAAGITIIKPGTEVATLAELREALSVEDAKFFDP